MIKREKKIASVFLIIFLANLLIGWFFLEPTSSAVTVSATVGSIIGCTTPLNGSSVAFTANLDDQAVYLTTPEATTTIATNTTIVMKLYGTVGSGSGDNGGLYKAIATTDLIESPTSTATTSLAAGTDGYGMQATSTGPNMLVELMYDSATSTAVIGYLATSSVTALTIASSSSAVSNEVITTVFQAAVGATTLQGSYEDTVTYSCTAT